MEFKLVVNEELEGWDILEVGGIQSDEGTEDSVVATLYEYDKAVLVKYLLEDVLK